jgi:ElaB/YqjD/DUF883 family membrane-anchored ribosome-binding protein
MHPHAVAQPKEDVMATHNGETEQSTFEHKFDSIKASMKDFAGQAKTRTTSIVSKLGAAIAKYPFAAVGIALGTGYLVARIARSK